MLTFISIAGFLIAVIIFLNLLQAGSPVKAGVTGSSVNSGFSGRMAHQERKGVPAGSGVAKVLREMKPDVQRPRICPVCGTVLSQEDYLFAAMEPEPSTNRKRQVQIYGCPFCYDSDGVNLRKNRIETMEPV